MKAGKWTAGPGDTGVPFSMALGGRLRGGTAYDPRGGMRHHRMLIVDALRWRALARAGGRTTELRPRAHRVMPSRGVDPPGRARLDSCVTGRTAFRGSLAASRSAVRQLRTVVR